MTSTDIKSLGTFSPEEVRKLVKRTRGKAFFLGVELQPRVKMPAKDEEDSKPYLPCWRNIKMSAEALCLQMKDIEETSAERIKHGRAGLLFEVRQSERCMFIR